MTDFSWDDIGEADTDDATVVDKYGLASFTGLTIKQIDAALKDGLPTHGERRKGAALKFSVPEVVQWLLDKNEDPMQAAKRRQALAIADKREAEAKKITGTYVELETVTAAIRDNVAKMQSELRGIAPKCPPDIRDFVDSEVNAAINRLCGSLASWEK